MARKDDLKEYDIKKVQATKKDANIKEIERSNPSYSLENVISTIKILIPFKELLINLEYRNHIIKMLKAKSERSNTLNLQDDHPTILFGPRVGNNNDDDEVPPFFISLNVHNMILHNVMLDSEASHNLMPKVIMENLGFDITRQYKDIMIQERLNVWD